MLRSETSGINCVGIVENANTVPNSPKMLKRSVHNEYSRLTINLQRSR